jgi:hypothetical protein
MGDSTEQWFEGVEMPGQCWDEAVTWLHTVEMGKMDEIWSIKLYPFLEKL